MVVSVVLLCLITAPATLLIRRFLPLVLSNAVLLLLPLALFAVFGLQLADVADGSTRIEALPWVEPLGMDLNSRIDSFNLLFILLIIGTHLLSTIYALVLPEAQLQNQHFFTLSLLLLGALLGVMLVDNILTLALFWLLAQFLAYLLVGGNAYHEAGVRTSSRQFLTITLSGGWVLLSGLLVLSYAPLDEITLLSSEPLYNLSALQASAALLIDRPLTLGAVLFIAAGCVVTACQVPAHFWLTHSLQTAPQPGLQLHLLLLVLVGLSLPIRLHPILQPIDLWNALLILFGVATLLYGSVLALAQQDLRRWLAYLLISQAGLPLVLLGLSDVIAYMALLIALITLICTMGALLLLVDLLGRAAGSFLLAAMPAAFATLPITSWLLVLAGVALTGLPLTIGYLTHQALFEVLLLGSAPLWLRLGLFFLILFGLIVRIAAIWRIVAGALSTLISQTSRIPLPPVREVPPQLLLVPALFVSLSLALSWGLGLLIVERGMLQPAVLLLSGAAEAPNLINWQNVMYSLLPALLLPMLVALPMLVLRSLHSVLSMLSLTNHTSPVLVLGRQVLLWLGQQTERYLLPQRPSTMLVSTALIWVTICAALSIAVVLSPGSLTLARPGPLLVPAVATLPLFFLSVLGILLGPTPTLKVVGVSALLFSLVLLLFLLGAIDLALFILSLSVWGVVVLERLLSRLAQSPDAQTAPARLGFAEALVGGLVGVLVLLFALIRGNELEAIDSTAYYTQNSIAVDRSGNLVQAILGDFRSFDLLSITVLLFASVLVVLAARRKRSSQNRWLASTEDE